MGAPPMIEEFQGNILGELLIGNLEDFPQNFGGW